MDILTVMYASEWEGIQHRPHHFAKRYAAKEQTNVLYVEPPVSLLAPLKNRRAAEQWERHRQGVRKQGEGLYVYSLPPVLPFANQYRFVNRRNLKKIARDLERVLTSFHFARLVLYAFLPNAADLVSCIPFDKVIYDCMDDYASFTGLIDPKVVRQMERELIIRSDVCFATANQLLEERKEWNENFHLVPNGVEYERFSVKPKEPAEDIRQIDGPVVGFIGTLSDWVDIELMAKVAGKMKHVSFVWVGPSHTNVDSLRSQKNVHLLGPKPYEDLPAYIHHFDVCVIPFKINQLTVNVNPVKMYEYFATGRPVVSAPLPEVKKYEGIVEIAETKEEWVDAIEKALSEDSVEKSQARKQIAQENSWEARWEKVDGLIERN
jgi:glycosyltransferase involved in cell wall biosynthesis